MSESSSNPYVSPASRINVDPTIDPGVWRDGDYLVVRRKKHSLPDRCVLCNSEAQGRRVRVKLAKIAGWFTSAMIENSSTVVRVGICSLHLRRRRRALLFRWLSMPVAAALAAAVFVVQVALKWRLDFPIELALVLACAAVGTVGQVYGMNVARIPLAPVRIDRGYVWIQGVCPEYLAAVPEIPTSANG